MSSTVIDVGGIYGAIFNYANFFFFFGATLCLFFYFWSKGALDMNEEPAIRMMQDEEKR